MTTPPTTSSTPTSSSSSSNEKSESSYTDSDFLFFDETPKVDATPEAAAGINFLFTRFPYAVHTFQFFPSKATRTFTPEQKEAALKECLRRNAAGDDVFFMVNEGDGVTADKTSVRCASAIHELKWCYIDTDTCPVEKVEAYLKAIGLTPHVKIQSSNFEKEGPRFHLYFQIDPVEKTPANLVKWRAIQDIISRLGNFTLSAEKTKEVGCDPSMNDHAKLLRVPGFSHVKKSSLVCVVETQDFPPYALTELFELTGAQQLIDYCQEESGTNGHSGVPALTDHISFGNRFFAVRSLGMSLADDPTLSKEEKIKIFTTFCVNNVENKDFEYVRPDKTLTPYCMGFLTSGLKKKAKEVAAEVSVIQTTAEEAPPSADEPEDAVEKVVSKNIADRFGLPDETYLNAPNGFGDVVGQVMQNMLYPSAALAFATALPGAAFLKAITHMTPFGSGCNLYVVAVASSGSGKNYPKSILHNTMVDCEYAELLDNEFRSGAAIGSHLEFTGGAGFYIRDEIGIFLSQIQNPKADKNEVATLSKILELYTAISVRKFSFGKLANSGKKGGSPIVRVDHPMMGIMGYTTYAGFSKMFGPNSILSGLFQRFIIVSADFPLILNPNADPEATIKSPFFPKGLLIKQPSPLVSTDDSESTHTTTRKLTKLKYNPAAHKRAIEVMEHYRKLVHKLEKEEPGSLKGSVYVRHAENTDRVASVLCGTNAEIDLATYDWAYNFMTRQQDALMSIVNDIAEGGTESTVMAEQDKIKYAIIKDMQETGYPVGRYREVWKKVQRVFPKTFMFDRAIEEGKRLGLLKLHLPYVRSSDGLRIHRAIESLS